MFKQGMLSVFVCFGVPFHSCPVFTQIIYKTMSCLPSWVVLVETKFSGKNMLLQISFPLIGLPFM